MANELVTTTTSGLNIYAIVLYNGQAWNNVTQSFQNWNSAVFSNYAISLTEQDSSGIYIGSFPSGITTLGRFNVLTFQRSGAMPAVTDFKVSIGTIDWLGSFESSTVTLSGLLGVNQGIRNMVYDGSNNLTSFDICIYDTAGHATTNDGATGLVHKYSVASTYSTNQTAQSTTQIS